MTLAGYVSVITRPSKHNFQQQPAILKTLRFKNFELNLRLCVNVCCLFFFFLHGCIIFLLYVYTYILHIAVPVYFSIYCPNFSISSCSLTVCFTTTGCFHLLHTFSFLHFVFVFYSFSLFFFCILLPCLVLPGMLHFCLQK